MKRRILLLMALFVIAGLPCVAEAAKADKAAQKQAEKPFILPYREDSALTVVEEMIADEKWAQALHVVEGVLKRHPENADAFTYRGYIRYRMGERDMAVEDYKQALQISPTHQAANKYLADVFLDDGDMARAREQMQVLRMVCGESDCAELNDLEAKMNRSANSSHRRRSAAAKDKTAEEDSDTQEKE